MRNPPEGSLRFKLKFMRKFLKLMQVKLTPRNLKFYWSFTRDATYKVLESIEDALEDR